MVHVRRHKSPTFYLMALVASGVLFTAYVGVLAQPQKADHGSSLTGESIPVGYWQSVDFVEKVEDFTPGKQVWKGDLFLKKIRCYENGETSIGGTCKNGWIIDENGRAIAQYYTKSMGDETYLFLPWLSGDVTLRGQKPRYYIFKKIPDQPFVFSPIRSLELPQIVRHPSVDDFGRAGLESIPSFNPASNASFQVDLRGYDLSGLDLKGSLNSLLYADFDDKTIWPPENRMPKGFDWQRSMESGKNPGLGIRNLHSTGITGRNVGIAIIDATLLVDHQEYKDRLRWYEETDDITGGWLPSQMHGPAVASISVGKTVGVAPEADLYYIATSRGGNGKDFSYLARSIRHILEINRLLPDDRKIRVIAMQIGWNQDVIGYNELKAAYEEAKASGMLIVCSSINEVHGFRFHGLGRPPMSDPDNFESYEPGLWWAERYYSKPFNDCLLVPMDSRTTASPCGSDEYVFYREGGWSWSIPYIAGVYTLAVQVDPAITPEKFWDMAMKTGKTIELKHGGKILNFGPILNPAALIEGLEIKTKHL